MKKLVLGLLMSTGAFFCGCASYITPGGRADFAHFSHPSIAESFAVKPAASIPAAVAFVRVQEPAYYSYHAHEMNAVWGQGRYSVITTREVGEDAVFDRLRNLPGLAGAIGLNRMLLPEYLESDRELREAAARLKADMLVLYTFDTVFRDQNHSVPLTMITLGSAPTKKIAVHVTASALVLDTRTGFIYAAFEATERRDVDASLWSERQKADLARQEAEAAAFRRLMDEFESNWHLIVDRAGEGA